MRALLLLPFLLAVAAVAQQPTPRPNIRVVPTFLALAGSAATEAMKLDGVDLLPRVTGAVDALPERALFWRKDGADGCRAVRRGRYKLLVDGPDDEPKLFDLAADVTESEDVRAAHPDVAAALAAELASWERELVRPLWGKGSQRAAARQPRK